MYHINNHLQTKLARYKRAWRIFKAIKIAKRRISKIPRINVVKNREESLNHCRGWSDVLFYMMTGFERRDFFFLLKRVDKILPKRNIHQAKRAYKSGVCNEMRLIMTLRMLRGASYLEMDWLGVSVWHVWEEHIYPCLRAIITALKDNIHFDCTDDAAMKKMEEQWAYVQIKKYGRMVQICLLRQFIYRRH